MCDISAGAADYRLRCLKSVGYFPKGEQPFAWPLEVFHRLNPERAYDPEHLLCYLTLHANGRLTKSRYCDDWEMHADEDAMFEAFVAGVPRPTLRNRFREYLTRLIAILLPPVEQMDA